MFEAEASTHVKMWVVGWPETERLKCRVYEARGTYLVDMR